MKTLVMIWNDVKYEMLMTDRILDEAFAEMLKEKYPDAIIEIKENL